MKRLARWTVIYWLGWDTFRQARSSRVFWLMLGISALCIMLCLSLRIDGGGTLRLPGEIDLYGGDQQPLAGPNPRPGHLTLAFGGIELPLFRGVEDEVHFLQVVLARWILGVLGTFLLIVGTAGFLPEFLQPDSISVLLSKPVSRSSLVLGKVAGVLVFAVAQIGVFIVGTWLALGFRTGIWAPAFLLSVPLLILQFFLVYSMGVLLAIGTRHSVPSAVGAVLFWALCFVANYSHYVALVRANSSTGPLHLSLSMQRASSMAYWVMPKPADIAILLERILKTADHFSLIPDFHTVEEMGAFHPVLSVVTSVLFSMILLAISVREFNKIDY
jgi:ABC-type transport system involved in multi-copper enzyme maturation permease subunit